MTEKAKGYISALSANIIWGFVAIAFKQVKSYPSDLILFTRIIVASLFTLLFIVFFRRSTLIADYHIFKDLPSEGKRRTVAFLFGSGVGITLNWFAFIYVVNNVNIKSAAFAYMICPLMTAIAGALIYKEKLEKFKVAGICMAIISLAVLSYGFLENLMWSMLIASFYTVFILTQKQLKNYDSLNVLLIQLIIGFFISLPIIITHKINLYQPSSFWVMLVVIGILFTLIPLLLSVYAINKLPSSTMGILIYINPVVAFSVAFFYFKEPTTFIQGLSYLLIVFAVLVFNWKALKSVLIKNSDRYNNIDFLKN